MHRLIVTSATYRQASRFRDQPSRVDAGNRLVWRMTPRRLDAEVVRDAVLSVSGELNREIGGPGFYDFTTSFDALFRLRSRYASTSFSPESRNRKNDFS